MFLNFIKKHKKRFFASMACTAVKVTEAASNRDHRQLRRHQSVFRAVLRYGCQSVCVLLDVCLIVCVSTGARPVC